MATQYQKQTIKDLVNFPNKISFIKNKAKKFKEDFNKAPEDIIDFTKNIIIDIKKKIGISIPKDLEVKVKEKYENLIILSSNVTDSLFIFLNEDDHCCFLILNKVGQITFSEVFLGQNINLNVQVKKKRRGGRKPGSKNKINIEKVVEEFIKEYFEGESK